MRSCRNGVVFFGFGLSRSRLGHRAVEALLLLVVELNAHTRFHVRRLRGSGDVGWQGGPYQTPHFDALALASIRLRQHSSLPVCSPTRSALLSGRFNRMGKPPRPRTGKKS